MKTPLWKTTLWIAGFIAANTLPLNAADPADPASAPLPHRRAQKTLSHVQPHARPQLSHATSAELRAKKAAGTLTQEEQVQLDRIEKRIAQGFQGEPRGPRHAVHDATGPSPKHAPGPGPGVRLPHRRGGGARPDIAPGASSGTGSDTDAKGPGTPLAGE